MKILDAEIDIDAPPERVWAIVADFASYPEWNPFMRRVEGDPSVDGVLKVTIEAPGFKPVTFTPRVLAWDPPTGITWLGHWHVAHLFDGRHSLTVEPLPGDRARFRTHEEVTGLLLPALGKVMRASQTGFELMSLALKKRAESADS